MPGVRESIGGFRSENIRVFVNGALMTFAICKNLPDSRARSGLAAVLNTSPASSRETGRPAWTNSPEKLATGQKLAGSLLDSICSETG